MILALLPSERQGRFAEMREQLAAQPQSGSHPSSPVALLLALPIFGRAAVPARTISFADCSLSLPPRPCRCGAPPSSGLPVPPPASLYLIYQQICLKGGFRMAFMSATLTDVTSMQESSSIRPATCYRLLIAPSSVCPAGSRASAPITYRQREKGRTLSVPQRSAAPVQEARCVISPSAIPLHASSLGR